MARIGTSLVAQLLRLHVSTAGGVGLIPGRGIKIPHAALDMAKNKPEKKVVSFEWLEFSWAPLKDLVYSLG